MKTSATTSPVPSSPERQADMLVAEIADRAAVERHEMLAAAARQADEVRQRARIKARRQMQRAVAEMRAIESQRTLQVRAELEAELRRRESSRAQTALATAWPRLADALQWRWHDPASRRSWIDAQLAIATQRLGHGGWTVRHPAAWSELDRAALQAALQRHGVAQAQLQRDARLAIGLVIEVDGAALDSSPKALLADRPAVEAVLRAALDAAAAAGQRHG